MGKKVINILLCSLAVLFILTMGNTQGKFDNPPAGYFYIKSVQTGFENTGYWDQPGVPDNFDSGVTLSLNNKDGGSDQQYRFMKAGEGYFYIQSKNGGLADVSGNRKENGTSVMIWRGHGGSNQLFRFKHLGEGRWKIYAKNGTVVCAERGSIENSKIHIWEDLDGTWMEWFFEDVKTGVKYLPSGSSKPVKTK